MDGVVFDLKEFAVHDGPGVRQTVFLKGCPLRCMWCHNPEGLSVMPQLMVSGAACTGCGQCQKICRHPDFCTACGDCVTVCPQGIRKISGERVSVEELEQRIRKNSSYYQSLGGGVTFSGGEPLLQGAFLSALLDRLSDLHCAIETCGHAKPEIFREVVGKLQFVLLDVKLADPEQHRRYTGQDNVLILENLQWLRQTDIPFIVRIPLIPGVNDTAENYGQTAELLAGIDNLLRVELLPYHKTAGAKYRMLGEEYRPAFDPDRPVAVSHREFEEQGIRSVVL